MAAVSIDLSDLAPFAPDLDPIKGQAMIDDALARAAVVAPCILSDEFDHEAAAKAIIRGAILRWNEAGTGAMQSVQTGPFGATTDTRQARKGMFWPSEIDELKSLCGGAGKGGAFAVDTVGWTGPQHADICSLNFGATYCSCGADLTGGGPLWDS